MTRAADLCTDCGLCCDGTLFSSVSLDPAGLITAREHRLPVLETVDSCKLQMPCPALRDVLCGVYEDRPEECADFSCDLLERVEGGQQSFEGARRIIEETRALRARLSETIGDTPWWTARRSLLDAVHHAPDTAGDRDELLADLNALAKRVRRHFLG
ncbi:MAG: YkgJ family cysteine cluster protein [Polyangiaceae bacterium]